MIVELNRNHETMCVSCEREDCFEDIVLKRNKYVPVDYRSIRDWESVGFYAAEVGKLWANPDATSLYVSRGWHGEIPYEYILLEKIAKVIPSTKYDLGTRTIELTDLEAYNLKTEFLKEGMRYDVEDRWNEMVDNGEIPEDINPDFYEILDLAETRQTGDFTYNDAYWRTIEDAINDYIEEIQYERPE